MNIASVGAQAYQRMSSGLRINSAADDAAGLSITQGMTSEVQAMQKNTENIGSMNDLTKTAEGALGNIQDSLGRMRELAVQASNGILTDGDKSKIQVEINQLKEGITSMAQNTEFNGMKLLDGSFANKNTAMNTDGSGKQISIASAALDNLGISGFDVTGSFDISDIDKAMEKVSESRSNLGSVSNAFEYANNNVRNTMTNVVSSRSRIQDADMAEEISNLRRDQVLQQYKLYTMRAKEEQDRAKLGIFQPFDKSL